ncbi:YfbU family protein [uncultured Acinetobacter sp.]|uniref:YfbU family protein n=1 Tax=uncultured Acinetobacter sp. TaxID=165433 RepID=UPI0025855C12|nr:YfbU family protein [uncultured Acinetobacter sp.]
MKIELSDKERLFLSNQYEILGTLKDDDFYLRLAEQLREGHKWLYEQSFDSLYENFPEESSELVIDILQVYEALQDSYDALAEKSDISEYDVKFAGFDGNNETDFMGFVDALKESNRFVSVIEAGTRNSHFPKVHTYQTMITKWRELNESHQLSKDEILYILGKNK